MDPEPEMPDTLPHLRRPRLALCPRSGFSGRMFAREYPDQAPSFPVRAFSRRRPESPPIGIVLGLRVVRSGTSVLGFALLTGARE
jgi:hypothetical protein